MEDLWKKPEEIITIFQERDLLILDRGFRDVIELIESSGVETVSPPFLKEGQLQFTPDEANQSRRVTKLRWIVESVNSRLKLKFRFFQETIPVSYFKKLNKFLQVAVAIINAFSLPLFTETEQHELMAEIINNNFDIVNKLQRKVVKLDLHRKNKKLWDKADEDCVLDFPELTMDDLEILTLGQFQLKQGELYNRDHIEFGGKYNFEVHANIRGLIRVRLQSRFIKSKKHYLWIQYKPKQNGRAAIVGHYCQCKSGARTLGSCSHIAGVSCQ
jgi:DDE superfamily endonuclease